jgi:dolichyl-phosphate beta-glucosyltransferase
VISLVLPAFNPGDNLEQTWLVLRDLLRTQTSIGEILLVLDGCTDDSSERLTRLRNQFPDPRMRVIEYAPNRGKGYAVRTGLLAAHGELRIFTDIDLAYGIDDVLRLARVLQDGASFVVASRNHPESQIQLPAKLLGYVYTRQWQSWVFNRMVRTILPIHQTDTQAGLKGMTAQVAEHILPALTCDGFGFDCEMLTACQRASIPITEVPVQVRYDSSSSTTGSRSGLRMLRELFAIRRHWKKRTLPTFQPVAPSEPLRKAA